MGNESIFVWGIEAKLFIREMKANIVLGYEGKMFVWGMKAQFLFGK